MIELQVTQEHFDKAFVFKYSKDRKMGEYCSKCLLGQAISDNLKKRLNVGYYKVYDNGTHVYNLDSRAIKLRELFDLSTDEDLIELRRKLPFLISLIEV